METVALEADCDFVRVAGLAVVTRLGQQLRARRPVGLVLGVIPLIIRDGFRYSFPSRSPFPVLLDTLSNAERGDLAD
jgi:hypothetical protein